MSTKTTLAVVTPLGTFTRTTGRTYTHLVVVKGLRAERLEASRLGAIASHRRHAAQYAETQRTGIGRNLRQAGTVGGDWDRECCAKNVASGEYGKWAAEYAADAARLEALGPITQDAEGWSLTPENLASTPVWGVVGWCGRLDLAVKLAAKQDEYRHVAIVTVADGTVREIR